MRKHCSILLVNWNGWRDTLECLETALNQNYYYFDVIVVDNASTDDTLNRIIHFAANSDIDLNSKFPHLVNPLSKRPIDIIELSIDEIEQYEHSTHINQIYYPKIIIIKNKENIGFARANNIAIKFAIEKLNSVYLYLLNNDTVIEKNALSKLIKTLQNNSDFSVLQSAIYYYDYPQKIWHAGGRILPWAQVRYYKKITKEEIKPITFISGCALFVKAEVIKKYSALSEKFFHGEEDFEFSMRMNKNRLKMASVGGSIVYHKVSISVSKKWKDGVGKILNFALNRIINMRDFYPKIKWRIWRIFALFYFYFLMIILYRFNPIFSLKLILAIYKWSTILTSVSSKDIDSILKEVQ